jgi:CubicO group peptidase (beta-lactamase class C family)
MVGGSASYLGVIPSLELGVVVLTNTAKSVDGVGTKVLRELIELKKKQQVPS